MPQHSKKTAKTGRADLSTAREPESSFIVQTNRPALGNKAEWVRGAFARGVSFRELIKGSGLKSKHVLTLCGLNPDEHVNLVAELEAFRINLLYHKD